METSLFGRLSRRFSTDSECCLSYWAGDCVYTYAALFHTMTSLSSPPEARHSPLLDQRTQFTQAAETHTNTSAYWGYKYNLYGFVLRRLLGWTITAPADQDALIIKYGCLLLGHWTQQQFMSVAVHGRRSDFNFPPLLSPSIQGQRFRTF